MTTAPSQAPAARRGSAGLSLLKELVIVVVGALVVSSLLRAFVVQMFVIPSESMYDTLHINDRVVVEKFRPVQRGNVVVFQDPGNWLREEPVGEPSKAERLLEFVGVPTAASPKHLIKRVIGMPGDRVVCCDTKDRLTVNGYPLDEGAYLNTDADGVPVKPAKVPFEVVVPRDKIFVMGDNRPVSADSRCHLSDYSATQGRGQVAFVPVSKVVGPAVAIVVPLSRASRLPIPATFSGVPGATEPAPVEAVINRKSEGC